MKHSRELGTLDEPVRHVEFHCETQEGYLTINDTIQVAIPRYPDFLLVWSVAHLVVHDNQCRKWQGVTEDKLRKFIDEQGLSLSIPTRSLREIWTGALWAGSSKFSGRWPELRTLGSEPIEAPKEDLRFFLRYRLFPRPRVADIPAEADIDGRTKLFCIGSPGKGEDAPVIELEDTNLPDLSKTAPIRRSSTGREATVQEHLQKLHQETGAWQKLPDSHQFDEPIPLATTAAKHRGGLEPGEDDRYAFSTVREAVEYVFDQDDIAVLFGRPGAGKSVSMKWLAHQWAKEILEAEGLREDARVPVYVDLGKWMAAHPDCESLKGITQEKWNGPDDVSTVWLLDGLDLLGRKGLTAASVLKNAREAASPRRRFLISSRPLLKVEARLDDWSESWRIALEGLEPEARAEWLDDNCREETQQKLSKFTLQNPEMGALLDTPLFFAMALSVCLDKELPEEHKQIRWDLYPGRAGLLNGFTTYAVQRAFVDDRITEEQWKAFHDEYCRAVHGIFWAAVVKHPRSEWFPASECRTYSQEAFQTEVDSSNWRTGLEVLEKAGLIRRDNDVIHVIHEQFGEHWGACHLRRMLRDAHGSDEFEETLWSHLQEKRLDPVTAQAVGMFTAERNGRQIAETIYDILAELLQSEVTEFLPAVGGKWALEKLTELLQHKKGIVRKKAMRGLGALGLPEAVQPLIEAFQDKSENPWVRVEAAWALQELGRPEGVQPLIEVFQDKSENPWVRWGAGWALEELDRPQDFQPLIEVLKYKSEDRWVRQDSA